MSSPLEEAYRGKGIRNALYQQATAIFGEDLVPARAMTEASVRYWRNRGHALPPGSFMLITNEEWAAKHRPVSERMMGPE